MGINQQAPGGVRGNNQMTGAKGDELLPVSRRHREPTLVIQADRCATAKHFCPFRNMPFYSWSETIKISSHFYPLLSTVVKKNGKVKEQTGPIIERIFKSNALEKFNSGKYPCR